MVELPTGLEPVTYRLQGGCSTIELWEQIAGIRGPAPHQEEFQGKSVFIFSRFLAGVIFGDACSPSA